MRSKILILLIVIFLISSTSATTNLHITNNSFPLQEDGTLPFLVSTSQPNANLSIMVIKGQGAIDSSDRVMTKFSPTINTNYTLFFTTTPFNESAVSSSNIKVEMKQDNITHGGTLNDTASTAVWTEVRNTGAANGGLYHNETGGIIGGAYAGYWANSSGFDNHLANLVPTFTIGTTTDFSMTAWTKANERPDVSALDALQTIIGDEYGVRMTFNIDSVNFGLNLFGGYALNMDDSSCRFASVGTLDGKWHYSAYVRDYTSGSTSNVLIYTDGVLTRNCTLSK